MNHTEISKIITYLHSKGFESTDNPVYFKRKNIAIDVFSDGLIHIWRIKQNEKIGEFKVESYEEFTARFRELKRQRWGLR